MSPRILELAFATRVTRHNMLSILVKFSSEPVWMADTVKVLSELGTFEGPVDVSVMVLAVRVDGSPVNFLALFHTFVPFVVEVEVPPGFFVHVWISQSRTQGILRPLDTVLGRGVLLRIILKGLWRAVPQLIHQLLLLVCEVVILTLGWPQGAVNGIRTSLLPFSRCDLTHCALSGFLDLFGLVFFFC